MSAVTVTVERDFGALLESRGESGLSIVLGLDPTIERIPEEVPESYVLGELDQIEMALAFYRFCMQKVLETHDRVLGYKLNTAFFEAAGASGYELLRQLIRYIHRIAPGVVVIIDCKRTDIGKSNFGTADFMFGHLGADAITVNPYFGEEALRPFLDRKGKGVIVLCRTSNEGAKEFQNLLTSSALSWFAEEDIDSLIYEQAIAFLREIKATTKPLYQEVAERISKWKSEGTICVVVGATAPEEMAKVREILPGTWILAPGVGAQGGSLEASVDAGSFKHNCNMGIMFNGGSNELYAADTRSNLKGLQQRIDHRRHAA
jgi:orotidine 5'-phosphate decarboxylase subfamily 2